MAFPNLQVINWLILSGFPRIIDFKIPRQQSQGQDKIAFPYQTVRGSKESALIGVQKTKEIGI